MNRAVVIGVCASLAGCGLMKWIGFAEDDPATGEVVATEAGKAADSLLYGLIGFSVTRVYDALFTKRGWDNLRNAVSPETGWGGFAKSVILSIIMGWHTPEEAKANDEA